MSLTKLLTQPLILGTSIRELSAASMAIVGNERLIEVNQDDLMHQGTLRAAFDDSGKRAPTLAVEPVPCVTGPPCAQQTPWLTHCSFGSPVAPPQRWEVSGRRLMQASTQKCLARTTEGAVTVAACEPSADAKLQQWDLSRVNSTVSQVRDDKGLCLTFNSSSLHMESCRKEAGDKSTPNGSGCEDGNCRFSGIIYQLWYLNTLGQLASAITNIPNGAETL